MIVCQVLQNSLTIPAEGETAIAYNNQLNFNPISNKMCALCLTVDADQSTPQSNGQYWGG